MFKLLQLVIDSFTSDIPEVNPATGLPMIDSVHDVAGNDYGFADSNNFDNDMFSSNSFSSFD